MSAEHTIDTRADLTIEWLSTAVGAAVADFDVERIGTGQMSESYRVRLQYANGNHAPASVVLKIAASDLMSRQTGMALGLYEREVRFYAEVAPRIGGPIGFDGHYRVGGRQRYGLSAARARWLDDGVTLVLDAQTPGNDDAARATHLFGDKTVEVRYESANGFRTTLTGRTDD